MFLYLSEDHSVPTFLGISDSIALVGVFDWFSIGMHFSFWLLGLFSGMAIALVICINNEITDGHV